MGNPTESPPYLLNEALFPPQEMFCSPFPPYPNMPTFYPQPFPNHFYPQPFPNHSYPQRLPNNYLPFPQPIPQIPTPPLYWQPPIYYGGPSCAYAQ